MRISDWSSDVCSSDLDWIAGARTVFASWLTFAPDGGNDPSGLRWYTLQGSLDNPSPDATLDIFINEGGSFGDGVTEPRQIGRASCRERVWQDVSIAVVAVSLNKKNYNNNIYMP